MDQPADWYPDPDPARASAGMLRYWNGEAWTDNVADANELAPATERIEPWALVISVLPLIGLVGGAIAFARGKRRNGTLMMLIGFVAFVVLAALQSR